jgi:hypothetical protein
MKTLDKMRSQEQDDLSYFFTLIKVIGTGQHVQVVLFLSL